MVNAGSKVIVEIFETIYKTVGVLTHGGILSHVAVIAREFKKTCLVDPLDINICDYENEKILIDNNGNIFLWPK